MAKPPLLATTGTQDSIMVAKATSTTAKRHGKGQEDVSERRASAEQARLHAVSDSDEAPEEESNVQSRKAIRKGEEEQKAEQKRKADARRKILVSRQQRRQADKAQAKGIAKKDEQRSGSEEDQDEADEPAVDSDDGDQLTAVSATRLDPALFAASFSEPVKRDHGDAFGDASTSSSRLDAAKQKRQAKRRGGIVKGRDGQPMVRLDDGRTTVRVLDKPKVARFDEDDQRNTSAAVEPVLERPAEFDASQSLPTAKARKYKKRKLGLTGTQDSAGSAPQALRSKPGKGIKRGKKADKRSDEDPLGLQDPAFMQGGEMAHLGLSAVKKGSKSNRKAARVVSTARRGDAGRRRGKWRVARSVLSERRRPLITSSIPL